MLHTSSSMVSANILCNVHAVIWTSTQVMNGVVKGTTKIEMTKLHAQTKSLEPMSCSPFTIAAL